MNHNHEQPSDEASDNAALVNRLLVDASLGLRYYADDLFRANKCEAASYYQQLARRLTGQISDQAALFPDDR
jgi:hypothetical protein